MAVLTSQMAIGDYLSVSRSASISAAVGANTCVHLLRTLVLVQLYILTSVIHNYLPNITLLEAFLTNLPSQGIYVYMSPSSGATLYKAWNNR